MRTPADTLSEQRCWQLLATAAIGRLALSVRAMPVIIPVQYYLDGRSLAVCLGHRDIPARALDEVIIAFTADAIDPASGSGWSVQVQGKSAIARQHRFSRACGLPSAGQVVRISSAAVSGYQVHLCPYADNP
jgi:nitroimidazol reductase NimA-like FMN-containing flavoprotein (pyridoxamine 5'-phosphate oxidase superfamily)